MVKITIDGKGVLAIENTTVLEAAQQAGIYIPKLCFHSKLSRYGACRVCLVKIEGVPKLSAACAVIATEGMVITTSTPEINKIRKTIIELMLLYHPLDCLVCDKGGECELQTLVFKLGVTENRFKMWLQKYEKIDVNRLITRDMKKCILCGKCVRVCDEIRGRGAIGCTYRGFATRVDFPFGRISNCEACGQCLSVCPVGALAPRFSEYEARPWEMKHVQSVCPHCGCGCTVILDTKRNRVVRITSKEGLGVNDGKLCAKGRFGYDFVNNKSRLKYPLVKKNGVFVQVMWDEALDLVAKNFKEITEKYGSDKIGGIGSNRVTNEESYLFQKFMRAVLKTNNVDSHLRIEHAASFKVLTDSLGCGAATSSISEIVNAKVILLIGTDTTETMPIIGLEIKRAVRRRKAKLIVVNSRKIDLARFSNIWFQVKPGTELLLLSAILKVIIDEGLDNKSFIEKQTQDFDRVKTRLDGLSLDDVQRVVGIDKQRIREAARLYANAENAIVIYGLEFVLQEMAVDNVRALVNLVLACGHIGKGGSGIMPLRQTNNGQGTTDMGVLPDYLPGYEPVKNPGLNAVEMIQSIPEGKIRGMYIVGCNPAVSHPNSRQVEANLKSLDFLVVQDIFLSETAKLADVVLPAVSFAEKDGTFTSTERRIQKINKAIEPLGDAKPDSEIFVDLAMRFGYEMEMDDLKPIYKRIACLEQETLYKFCPVDYKYSVLQPTMRFPYHIIANGTLFHHRSGVMTRMSRGMSFVEKEPKLWMHPDDANGLLVEDDSLVKVTSRYGEIEPKVFVTNKVMQGMLFLPLHAGRNYSFNMLTSPDIKETFVDVIPADAKKEIVNLSINNKEVAVEQGTTILETAKKLDIYVPTLCYHSEMSPFGACRLCMVEVEGTNKLLAACITPVLNGMKVKTDTDEVRRIRKMILELLLAKHPVDCLVCDKSGECDLQKLSFLYGPDRNRLKTLRHECAIDDTRALVERDMSKCILCKKCVRACSEMQGANAIAFANRGFKTEVGTFFGRELDCEFCGRCVSVCPTGALTNKLSKHIARSFELKEVSTICPHCSCGCSIVLNIKDNKVVRVTAREAVGVNNGNLCKKGRYDYAYLNDQKRLAAPLIKKNGKFINASWEEAIEFIASKLKAIKMQAGPDAIMGLCSGSCTNEDVYVFQKFMRVAVGTNNVDTAGGYQMPLMANSFSEIANAKSIIVAGTDVTETHPMLALWIRHAVRKNDANLIVIDSKRTKLAQIAKLWLRREGIDIIKTAELLASEENAVVIYGGNVTECNSQGAHDMIDIMGNPAAINKFEEAWKVSLPVWPAVGIEKVKALYIMGELNGDFQIGKQEFLVVQDMFMTETVELADVVLPACSFAEIDGTWTNIERRVQLLRKALPPVGESRPNWRIICDVSRVMGYNMNYNNSSDVMDEIRRLLK